VSSALTHYSVASRPEPPSSGRGHTVHPGSTLLGTTVDYAWARVSRHRTRRALPLPLVLARNLRLVFGRAERRADPTRRVWRHVRDLPSGARDFAAALRASDDRHYGMSQGLSPESISAGNSLSTRLPSWSLNHCSNPGYVLVTESRVAGSNCFANRLDSTRSRPTHPMGALLNVLAQQGRYPT
jgi:hypothetical protein